MARYRRRDAEAQAEWWPGEGDPGAVLGLLGPGHEARTAGYGGAGRTGNALIVDGPRAQGLVLEPNSWLVVVDGGGLAVMPDEVFRNAFEEVEG